MNDLSQWARLQARRVDALLALPRLAEEAEDERQFLQQVLALAEALTRSRVSFFHFVGEDEDSIELVAWSARTLDGYCQVLHDSHYPVAQAGLWAEALRQRQPVVVNDYAAQDEGKRGLPSGHAPLQRLISLLVLLGERAVAVVGVGNKDEDYSKADVQSLQLLANAAWQVAMLRRQAREAHLADELWRHAHEGMFVTDAQRKILSVNASLIRMSGYSEEELLGQTPAILNSGRHDQAFFEQMEAALASDEGLWRGEIWNRDKDGVVHPYWMSITRVDVGAGQCHFLAVLSDLLPVKQSVEQLEYLSEHDALTGLHNRRWLEQELDRRLSYCQQAKPLCAVVIVGLDHFSRVNEGLGMAGGDAVLKAVARRLRHSLAREDLIARFMGDKFVLCLASGRSLTQIVQSTQALIGLMGEPLALPDHGLDGMDEDANLVLSASVGVSLFPEHADSAQWLLNHAERALRQAKSMGRSRVQFFEPVGDGIAREAVVLESALRKALDAGQLSLNFQPQLRLSDGELAGAEVLLRWQHPRLGRVSPARFIPLAEDLGLMGRIGDWVLREALAQLAGWRKQGLAVPRLAVNVSVRQLSDESLPARVEALLEQFRLSAGDLELELTESVLMHDPQRGAAICEAFRDLGVCMALDDFGTGYSSLSYLHRLPLDRLKIDRSFVQGLGVDAVSESIVGAIVALAKGMRITTIAEGAETMNQVAALRSLEVDMVQGYVCSKPMSAQDFAAWFQAPEACLLRLGIDN